MQSRCQRPDATLPFRPAGWHLQSDNRPTRDGNNSLYALHPAPLSSSHITSTSSSPTNEMDIMSTHPQSTTCTETCGSQTDREEGISREILPSAINEDQSASEADQAYVTTVPARKSVDWSGSVGDQQPEEDIMQISGKGHWFLEGWIGDHAVDFLINSKSTVTTISHPFFDRLSEAGAPVGILRPTTRKLRGTNGSQIEISGCSYCMVSFLGLRTEFRVLVCDLSTDAII